MSPEALSGRTFDVVVVGAGISGASAALAAAERGSRVALLTKEPDPAESNTRYAQGGIIYTAPEDSPERLTRDVLDAGGLAGDPSAVRLLAERGPADVRELLMERLSVPFDRDAGGGVSLTREGGHSVARIAHHRDTTGEVVQARLLEAIRSEPRITLVTGARASRLLGPDGTELRPGGCCSGVAVIVGEEEWTVPAGAVVLASGGYAALYASTTNPPGATGDGLALALRAGAATRDLHYVQFHPTALYAPGRAGRSVLVSEAVRGEGGVLVDEEGREVVRKHPSGSLAPRDAVSREAVRSMRETGSPCVYLDATPRRTGRSPGWFARRFPAVYAACRDAGVDPEVEAIPVAPAAHYTCGGVGTDLDGRTSVPGLLAAGEVASTGVHGANRLASTSLLEGLVFGLRAGRTAALEGSRPAQWPARQTAGTLTRAGCPAEWERLRALLQERAGILRDAEGLEAGLAEVEELRARHAGERGAFGDALLVAEGVLRDALGERGSRGCHHRTDMEDVKREHEVAGLPG
ncbi:Aspartate oxidase [Rubrobacter radiotolerans]|uniref:L-aspartate oxidase n=1 Tax=Rubrobacter radiotolerans TaxID=42256 RepID=A0A023WZ53_RUBRA|nr:FAD-dependent oxidoreductase [Rubrobacter radiotolerans]AHY45373.1 Aspartate oxidase [Rubrobacter radiotolerans]MDX5892784.1 FAD-dependent oxidoreductase [Rubrobacter radiotolerans]SMC02490.1 L-aspartate oxidase [Rubrobacter radiotolerans DSM 5868]